MKQFTILILFVVGIAGMISIVATLINKPEDLDFATRF
jgi:hypothetical protein